MFDRFEDDARKTMGRARAEAQRFQHDYIGTEHILLGLLTLDRSVAAQALRNLGVDLARIRREIEERMEPGSTKFTEHQLPFTPRAKSVLEWTLHEASEMGHGYLGTGHLLLGMLRQPKGIVAEVFRSAGANLDEAREQVRSLEEREHTRDAGEASPAILAAEVRQLREKVAALWSRVSDLEARVRELEGESS